MIISTVAVSSSLVTACGNDRERDYVGWNEFHDIRVIFFKKPFVKVVYTTTFLFEKMK